MTALDRTAKTDTALQQFITQQLANDYDLRNLDVTQIVAELDDHAYQTAADWMLAVQPTVHDTQQVFEVVQWILNKSDRTTTSDQTCDDVCEVVKRNDRSTLHAMLPGVEADVVAEMLEYMDELAKPDPAINNAPEVYASIMRTEHLRFLETAMYTPLCEDILKRDHQSVNQWLTGPDAKILHFIHEQQLTAPSSEPVQGLYILPEKISKTLLKHDFVAILDDAPSLANKLSVTEDWDQYNVRDIIRASLHTEAIDVHADLKVPTFAPAEPLQRVRNAIPDDPTLSAYRKSRRASMCRSHAWSKRGSLTSEPRTLSDTELCYRSSNVNLLLLELGVVRDNTKNQTKLQSLKKVINGDFHKVTATYLVAPLSEAVRENNFEAQWKLSKAFVAKSAAQTTKALTAADLPSLLLYGNNATIEVPLQHTMSIEPIIDQLDNANGLADAIGIYALENKNFRSQISDFGDAIAKATKDPVLFSEVIRGTEVESIVRGIELGIIQDDTDIRATLDNQKAAAPTAARSRRL